eukprot:3557268-Prymnesium_polylepis.1
MCIRDSSMTGAFTLQPFLSADGAVAALFNGEIYNYRELAKQLTGHEDTFSSDGFVIQPAYARWGVEFIRHLEGEFAVLLFDFRLGRAILSTDVFSTKPLWYAQWVAAGRLRWAAASYESVLSRLGAPAESRRMAEPNEAVILRIGTRSRADEK